MTKLMTAALLALTFAVSLGSTDAMARRGADDPAGHVRGEGAGHK
jgi:hypothetical protein